MTQAYAGGRVTAGMPPAGGGYRDVTRALPPDDDENLAEYAVAARGLTKVFPGGGRGKRRREPQTAVAGLDLTIEPGHILGLLGRNGAGKTTTVDMLTGMSKPTSGTVTIFGRSPQDKRTKERIGVVGQANLPWPQLTAWQNLMTQARLHHITGDEARKRAVAALDLADLHGEDACKKPVKDFSTGMRRRLQFWQNLLHGPRVLFLDEPTLGIDPHQRAELWTRIEEQRDSGVAVLLTTNTLEEAARLAGRVAIISNGSLVAEGTPDALQRRYGHVDTTVRVAATREACQAAIARVGGMAGVRSARCLDAGLDEAQFVITTDADKETTGRVVRAFLGDKDLDIRNVETSLPTLDEVFEALTGRDRTLE